MATGTSETVVPAMTARRAAQVLREYNEWRRGDHEPCDAPHTAKEIGLAIDFAVSVLEHDRASVSMEDIIRAVERETKVTEEEMVGKSRHREYSEARAMVCWLAYKYAGMTVTTIGVRFNRHHSMIVHYREMVNGWLEEPRRNINGAKIMNKLIEEFGDEQQS